MPKSSVIKDDYSKDDFQRDIEYQQSVNDIEDKSQNKEQGPTPTNQSNFNYEHKDPSKTIWNGPEGKRGIQPSNPSYYGR